MACRCGAPIIDGRCVAYCFQPGENRKPRPHTLAFVDMLDAWRCWRCGVTVPSASVANFQPSAGVRVHEPAVALWLAHSAKQSCP